MIRINLLPQAKKMGQKAAAADVGPAAQLWIAGYLAAVVVVGIGLGLFYYANTKTLSEKQTANQRLTAEIARETANSAGLDEVQHQLQSSEELATIANDLQRARLGPTRVLMELSRILSEGGGPTIDPQRLEQIRRDDPLAGYNAGWDPRRLWLVSFTEDNRDCKIVGVAKTTGDVSEFLARLALSDLFESVHFDKTTNVDDAENHLPLVGFEAACRVRY
ncbi:MAG: PilN domain-containing protein [Sandaracinaceae bacterium]|nr:PilN domain-containing protein [Sandaracinaceae bacterium]